jgi:hypothetical protein
VRQRQKRQRLVEPGIETSTCLPPQRTPLGRKASSGRDRIEDDGRLRVAEARGAEPLEAGEIAARAVQFLQQRFCSSAVNDKPAIFMRRLQHVDRDRRRVLGDGRERAGHQRSIQAGAGKAFEEAAPVDRALSRPSLHRSLTWTQRTAEPAAINVKNFCVLCGSALNRVRLLRLHACASGPPVLNAARSTAVAAHVDPAIFRVLVMSSSGFASRTTKSALLPAATCRDPRAQDVR